ncbi:MAG TPA: DUF4333 domain-containing protein [Euzebya sp.]|nr:DUF4333 domain-containing protein [Euzebya sp.]
MHRLALLSLLLLLAGCSDVSLSFGGLDTKPLEQQIAADIEEGIGAASGIDIDRVECPRNVQPRAGDVFVCRAFALDGSIGTVEVRQIDDAGSVEWELTDVAPPAAAE